MTRTPPLLVRNDPWLEPYSGVIERRMARFEAVLEELVRDSGSLVSYANGHKIIGIHWHQASSMWTVREWAPGAKGVSLIGEFNGWNRDSHPLSPVGQGVWQIQLPAGTLAHGQLVKLHITGADDSRRDRIPSTIRRAVQDPNTHDFSGQVWQPQEPYDWRHAFDPRAITAPFIYECHVGMAGEEPRVHGYREFADHILPRVAAGGYNTLQMMAVQEHPYYGSFGYHVSSFFAPSSRFGTPEDLKYLIDTAHGLGIAVLLDVVHSHAVKNMAEGLNDFDGTGHLYFHAGPRGDHPAWDSKCFDYGKPEVRRFLLSNLRYWLEEFRFDGFRFDGITSMLYHSRGMKAFGHYDDYFGADADDDAILYLQLATKLIHAVKPGAIIVAEDMSGMPGLCRPHGEGGAGFTHRLAMGVPDFWIKQLKHSRDENWNLGDLWSVMVNRRHGEATIAYAESHDQALVGDKTLAFWLMDKEMYWHMSTGDRHPVIERGIALHKMIRLATLAFGGEGWLAFMGNEFGHPEWIDFPRDGNNHSYQHCRRQWSLADDPNLKYQWLGDFDRAMLAMARTHRLLEAPAARLLYLDMDRKILCAERAGLVFVLNFSVAHSLASYPLHIQEQAVRKVVLDTDAPAFGGHGRVDPATEYPQDADGVMKLYTPARTGLVFAPAPRIPESGGRSADVAVSNR